VLLIATFSSFVEGKFQKEDMEELEFEEYKQIKNQRPLLNRSDRLRIRFRLENSVKDYQHIIYDGDEDDLELPNVVYYNADDESADETSDASSEDETNKSKENHDTIFFGDDQLQLLFPENGPISMDDDDAPKGLGELVLDKYLQHTFLKSAVILQMTREKHGFAIL
jgi:hypothetical protein